jgi:hypothetical protein
MHPSTTDKMTLARRDPRFFSTRQMFHMADGYLEFASLHRKPSSFKSSGILGHGPIGPVNDERPAPVGSYRRLPAERALIFLVSHELSQLSLWFYPPLYENRNYFPSASMFQRV